MTDFITIATEIDTLEIDGQKWIRKDAAEEKIIDGLKRAKKSYNDKIEIILQPIRDIKNYIVQDEIRNAIKETLRRGR